MKAKEDENVNGKERESPYKVYIRTACSLIQLQGTGQIWQVGTAEWKWGGTAVPSVT